MKKYTLFIFIFIAVCAFAKDTHLSIEQQIVNKITHALIPHKKVVRVYSYGLESSLGFKNNPYTKLVDTVKKADVLFIGKSDFDKKKISIKPIVVLKYSLLKEYPSALGAYYFQKNRPNIVMLEPRLKKMRIKLPKEFEKYTESKIW